MSNEAPLSRSKALDVTDAHGFLNPGDVVMKDATLLGATEHTCWLHLLHHVSLDADSPPPLFFRGFPILNNAAWKTTSECITSIKSTNTRDQDMTHILWARFQAQKSRLYTKNPYHLRPAVLQRVVHSRCKAHVLQKERILCA
jgi:hypothetical protein